MNRIFLPLYAILFGFILFFAPINEYFLSLFFQQQWEKDIAADYKGFYVILEKYFQNVPQQDWNQIVKAASKDSNIPMEIIALDNLQLLSTQLQDLQNGKTVVADVDKNIVYKRLGNSPYVIKNGPMHTAVELELGNIITSFSIILFFFALILIWAINLQRKMNRLDQVNYQFSQGNYSVRTSEKWYQRVGNLNKSFNQMAEQIQKQIRNQKELTNAVAHELRTPIACLRFEIAQLEEDIKTPDQRQCLEDMAEDMDKMDNLVEELLTYARFDYQDLPANPDTLEINGWLKHIIEQYRFPTTINIEVIPLSSEQTVCFEPHFMERAINNLISNALRYAENRIEITLETNSNNSINIHIDDDGPGIPVPERENLFSPFVRTDKSRARKTGGFGLGLAIVQKIVQWHGGKTSIDDTPIGGTRMTLNLPMTANKRAS